MGMGKKLPGMGNFKLPGGLGGMFGGQ